MVLQYDQGAATHKLTVCYSSMLYMSTLITHIHSGTFSGVLKVVCPGPGIVVLRNDSKPSHHIGVINGKGAVKANVRDK